MLQFRLAHLADHIRLAVLDTDITLLHFYDRETWTFVLKAGNRNLAGAELIHNIDVLDEKNTWWEITTLWSNKVPATMALLTGVLSQAKRVVPSSHITPAAAAVVAGFYKRYKDTGIVQDGILPKEGKYASLPAFLLAGYVWSDKLRTIPMEIEKVTDQDTMSDMSDTTGDMFGDAYSDRDRTKNKDLNFLLKKQSLPALIYGVDAAMQSYAGRFTILPWLKKNELRLRSLGFLEPVLNEIEESAYRNEIDLKDLERASFDPLHQD